ncbi:MAG: PIG-L family deacetylase [Candidatus Latescibacteria bacterium]|nr:PIG-L family deacetylase [Candidatus Latescibacterota bacterium]
MPLRIILNSICSLTWIFLCIIPQARAQSIKPVPDGKGSGTLAQAVLRLPVVASLLHTGAHPDDENSSLMAYVSRGLHARTAYLALNRGEGGQNLIGSELYDAIGIIRTEELMAARRFDGADQYFTRAFDFGYSKSADEAMEFWNQDEMLLADVVRIIRIFRPDVVVSVFAGSPRDGHGQHQAAGLMTREAFRAAADPNRFPEQIRAGLRPWQPGKLYINNTRASFESIDSLMVNTGDYSPVLNRSYLEIGLAGRSMHRSQDMGTIQRKGPSVRMIKLVERVGLSEQADDTHLFDGIDTSFMRLLSMAGADGGKIPDFASRLARLDALAHEVITSYRSFEPTGVLSPTLAGLQLLRGLRADISGSGIQQAARGDMLFLLNHKETHYIDVIQLALGLSLEVLADDEVVVPGSTFGINMALLNRSPQLITPSRLWLEVPEGWTTQSESALPSALGYNEFARRAVTVTVGPQARLSRPYWQRQSMRDTRVTVEDETLIGLPWQPPDVIGYARIAIDGVSIDIVRPVQFRYANRAIGEIRRALRVAPALSVTLAPKGTVVPVDGGVRIRQFKINVRNNVNGEIAGTMRLRAPSGWQVTPTDIPFAFLRENQEETFCFTVLPPVNAGPGAYLIQGIAEVDGKTYTEGYQKIAYPHIEPRHLYREASATVQVLDLNVAEGLQVGYIMGVGDDIPQTLRELGVQVQMLTGEDLATSDLKQFDVIITGIRAYEVRKDLVAMNQRLMNYVQEGGTYIVQYNKYAFNRAQYGPYPFQIRRPHDRVTREEAPVKILQPDHPVFNVPNKITEEDFKGWVQERGLYFLGEWDDRYTPLMSSQDPGEAPKAGGLIETRYGEGRYIYTGYAWFRQLPAGVPGALRFFANLISLPKTTFVP